MNVPTLKQLRPVATSHAIYQFMEKPEIFKYKPFVRRRTGSGLSAHSMLAARGVAAAVLVHTTVWLAAVSSFAAEPKAYAVLVEAKVTAAPPAVMLSWPAEAKATGYQISRKLRPDVSWGTPVSLPGSAVSWTDLSVAEGVQYEYQVKRSSTIIVPSISEAGASTTLTSYGYLCAGILIPPANHRGTVILVVDATMSAPLSMELLRLRDDLLGDGWSVIRHDVSRTASVTSVKALIKADYTADPGGVRAVFLFGRIPLPRSGDYAPGGHAPGHQGAFPADLCYGEMDGLWTDTTVNSKVADFDLRDCWNVPGDGKFDQTYVPKSDGTYGGEVELEVGRVDLWGMKVFLPKTETDLLRQYLNKDHRHRHAVTVLPRRALLTDGFGEFGGAAPAQSGWRSWCSLFGAANITEGPFDLLTNEGYLGYYGSGYGWHTSFAMTSTTTFKQNDPKAAFYMLWGSHFSDWNREDNVLRAPLATSYGLTSVYAGYPLWFMHTMSLGGTIGEAGRLVQNNRYLLLAPPYPILYSPPSSYTASTHIAVHGDPTLRLLAVAPAAALTIALNDSSHPALSWSASAEASHGYYIYRAASPGGPFMRLTAGPVTGTAWADSGITSGTFTYQVKAARLETTAGGTFINSSQAVSKTITVPYRYVSWAADNGLTGDAALPSADADGNGLANMIEYALGIPHGAAGAGRLPSQGIFNGAPALTFQELRSELTYQPEWSADLTVWETSGITIVRAGNSTTASFSMGKDRVKFMRLKILP